MNKEAIRMQIWDNKAVIADLLAESKSVEMNNKPFAADYMKKINEEVYELQCEISLLRHKFWNDET